MQRTIFIISIVILAFIVIGVLVFGIGGRGNLASEENNVSMADGKQIIAINAKGGYFPRVTNAKGDIPTVIKLNTQGTFDCSSAVTIPSLGYRNTLPFSGETSIDVPAQKAGTSINGTCDMGMYHFTINFD